VTHFFNLPCYIDPLMQFGLARYENDLARDPELIWASPQFQEFINSPTRMQQFRSYLVSLLAQTYEIEANRSGRDL